MDIDKYLETVLKAKPLAENDYKKLCEAAKEILADESNVQPINAPVNVCGDIHGQFFDVLELFRTGGQIPDSKYVFIGDFVDRGFNSVETFQLLLCYKVKYPGHITLLRGNHESRQVTQFYGFYEEAMRKYGNNNVWKYTTDVFDYLPIAGLIEGKVLCIHGGLSPDIKSLDQIRTIDRKVEIPHEGPFCDMMWSDPDDIETWAFNTRGAGWIFGSRVTKEFERINDLDLICRAHQLVQEGYQFWFPDKNLVTVWSAPNYCYRCGNVASILKLDENLNRDWKIFNSVPESASSQPPRTVLPYFL